MDDDVKVVLSEVIVGVNLIELFDATVFPYSVNPPIEHVFIPKNVDNTLQANVVPPNGVLSW
jgi:hypothetical protein